MKAIRLTLTGDVRGQKIPEAAVRRAAKDEVLGWAREDEDAVRIHAEGEEEAVDAFAASLGKGRSSTVEEVKKEGHEQFAIRGVPAGAFEVREHDAASRRFELRLDVGGAIRSWVLPKEPSMDPAVKRMAFEAGEPEEAPASIWDGGAYEQGGRVPWPEAIDRGHAVFVLHGAKLKGGFALQRVRKGKSPQWLLIKRRDDEALSGPGVTQ